MPKLSGDSDQIASGRGDCLIGKSGGSCTKLEKGPDNALEYFTSWSTIAASSRFGTWTALIADDFTYPLGKHAIDFAVRSARTALRALARNF